MTRPGDTIAPDREARRALANTLVSAPPEGAVDGIPVVSLGHDTDAELEVVAPLGAGGTGQVFLAHQRALHRDVAVKVLKDDAPDLGPCLVYEARVATRIDHPNVVPVYLLGKTADGMPVLVMKHIRGTSWLDLIERPDHPMWAELAAGDERLLAHLEILLSVCNGVHAAHRQGIVHRDIKPANVMVAGPGEVYLTDWGIAFDRAAPPPSAAGVVGTPAYMAPEMLSGDARDVDERADVFMLGACLHFALTGEHRNRGKSNDEALEALRTLAPYDYPPTVPHELAAICARATARDRSERFASVAEMREALQAFLHHHDSFRIAERARAEIDPLVARPTTDRDARHALEALRWTLLGALAAWPANTVARAQLERVRAREVAIELARGNVVAARTRLDELTSPAPELADEVARAEAAERERHERAARVAAYEHELDLRTAARTRRWFFTLFVVYGLAAAAAFVALRLGGEDMSGRRALGFSITSNAFYLTMLFVARREILKNRVNRAIVGLLGAFLLSNLCHRVIALALDGSPRLTIAVDTVGVGVTAALGALLVSPGLWVVSALTVVAVPISVMVPEASQAVFVGMCLVMIWRMLREWGRHPMAAPVSAARDEREAS